MAAREQAQQTREKKHGSNPGTFSPDDDEAQEADITRADARNRDEQRNAQGTRGEEGDVDEAGDEAEGDETPIGTDDEDEE
jgi:hypothetical protein